VTAIAVTATNEGENSMAKGDSLDHPSAKKFGSASGASKNPIDVKDVSHGTSAKGHGPMATSK
jgi:hypothetical protein